VSLSSDFIEIKAAAVFVSVQNTSVYYFLPGLLFWAYIQIVLDSCKDRYLVFLTLLMFPTSGGSQGLYGHRSLSMLAAKDF